MTLVQTEPKSIKIWSTDLKKVCMWVWGTEKQIRPAWRTPWANTIAYYPFETDINDYNWNYNLTNSWVTFSTINWVKCANFTSNVYAYSSNIPLPTWSSDRTISFWFYNTSLVGDTYFCWYGSHSIGCFFAPRIDDSYLSLMGYWNNYNYDYKSIILLQTGVWEYYTIVLSNKYLQFYKNGGNKNWPSSQRSYNTTAVWNTWKFTVWCRLTSSATPWNYINWYMSNLILENVARTDQEIADYYNLTKWNYWL